MGNDVSLISMIAQGRNRGDSRATVTWHGWNLGQEERYLCSLHCRSRPPQTAEPPLTHELGCVFRRGMQQHLGLPWFLHCPEQMFPVTLTCVWPDVAVESTGVTVLDAN
ncbi:unnamed protein product [Leuciscus chuanchicus]